MNISFDSDSSDDEEERIINTEKKSSEDSSSEASPQASPHRVSILQNETDRVSNDNTKENGNEEEDKLKMTTISKDVSRKE